MACHPDEAVAGRLQLRKAMPSGSTRSVRQLERRPTVREAHDPGGAKPRKGRVKAIGNVEIPQAESQPGGERAGLNALLRAGNPARRGFLAILKVDN